MMIDLGSGDPPKTLDADVAVIGAGAAGITMARAMVAAGRTVVLLESGGLDYEPATAALNAGRNVGEPYYDLEDSRLRFFGGTTAIWGGRSAELDPIDFERRDWVPDSGWPFGKDELKPWYAAARKRLELAPLASNGSGNGLSKLHLEELSVRHWSFDTRFDRFGFRANKDLVDDPRLTLVLHATVREIVADPSGRIIDSLDVRGPGKRRVAVRARTYVLATGGLENPRLLLASNSVMKEGLGNQHDLVGRYFMEHPHARGGKLVEAPIWWLLRAFQKRTVGGVQCAPLVTPSSGLQQREGLLNSALTIATRPPPDGSHPMLKRAYLYARHHAAPTKLGRGLWKTHRRLGRRVKQLMGPLAPWWNARSGKMDLALVIRAEQSPNPDSRLTLDRKTDSTGMPRIRLDWRLRDQDVETMSALVDAFGREADRLGLGRVVKSDWLEAEPLRWVSDPLVSAHPLGGYHHMGTTRMADDPKRGVTDQWGRVHGIENLYVAGSSLFPTGGWANPTLTILALTLRTADYLARR